LPRQHQTTATRTHPQTIPNSTTSTPNPRRRVTSIAFAHRAKIYYKDRVPDLFTTVTPRIPRASQQWPAERANPRAARAPAVRRLGLTAPRSSRAIRRALVYRYVPSLSNISSCTRSELLGAPLPSGRRLLCTWYPLPTTRLPSIAQQRFGVFSPRFIASRAPSASIHTLHIPSAYEHHAPLATVALSRAAPHPPSGADASPPCFVCRTVANLLHSSSLAAVSSVSSSKTRRTRCA
jgi:hypothetical protein